MTKPRITLSEVVEFDEGENIHVEVYPSGYCFVTSTDRENREDCIDISSLKDIDDLITLLGQARDEMRMAKGYQKGGVHEQARK